MNKKNISTFLFCLLLSLNLAAQKPTTKDDSKKPKKEKTFEDIITKEAITDKDYLTFIKSKKNIITK